MLRVGLAAPLEEEALGGRLTLRDGLRRDPVVVSPSAIRADWAAIEMNWAERRRRSSRASSSVMSISFLTPHSAPSRAVTDWRSAGVFPVRPPPSYGSAAGRPGSKLSSTSRPQTCSKRYGADELLDVDAAVAERAALAVGLGDLGLEGDDALESRLEVAHRLLPQLGSRTG